MLISLVQILLTRMTNDVDNVQTMIVLFCQLIFPAPIISYICLSDDIFLFSFTRLGNIGFHHFT